MPGARRFAARLIVSFPSTGGVDVSLHTLGLTRVRRRRRSLGNPGRPRRSETVAAIIDETDGGKLQSEKENASSANRD